MGLFSFIKSQCLKVIDWNDMTKNTIACRFQVPDRYEIMKNSKLVVRASQKAIFVQEGQLADIFEEGTYTLDDIRNIPILSKLANWKYAFESKFKGEVYFINTTQFTDMKWGTSNPVMMRDKDFGAIRLRGFGIYSFAAVDPEKLLRQLFGTRPLLTVQDVENHLKKAIVSKLTDAIAESGVPALDLARSYDELSEFTMKKLEEDFCQFGLELRSFYIENLSLPAEVEKVMDERTSMGIISDKMGTYSQYQAANAMRDAAKNTSGGFAGAGIGMGAGLGLGQMMSQSFNQAKDSQRDMGNSAPASACPKCGNPVDGDAKFCPKCGEKLTSVSYCKKCGAAIKGKAKFCPECGEKQ